MADIGSAHAEQGFGDVAIGCAAAGESDDIGHRTATQCQDIRDEVLVFGTKANLSGQDVADAPAEVLTVGRHVGVDARNRAFDRDLGGRVVGTDQGEKGDSYWANRGDEPPSDLRRQF